MYILRSKSILVLVFLGLALVYAAQVKDSSGISKKYTADELKNDFQLLRKALETTHPALYKFTPKSVMDSIFNAVTQQLDHNLPEAEFFTLIAPVCGAVKCGHTRISPSDAYKNQFLTRAKVFPFNIKVIGHKLLISSNFSSDSTIKPGTEISAINSVPSSIVLAKLLSMAFSDGNNQTMRPKVIEEAFAPYYNLAFGESETFSVEIQRSLKKEVVTVPAVPFSRERWKRKKPLEYKMIGGTTALLSIRTFEPPKLQRLDLDYDRFIDSVFTVVLNARVKHLILDLRNNNGGDPLYAAHLFSYLTDKTFGLLKQPEFKTDQPLDFLGDMADSSNYELYYKAKLIANAKGTFDWNDLNNDWYRAFEGKTENYTGKLYVLMDGGSFSTTGFFGSLVKYYKRGLIIGEESGGANVCNDCHGDLLLPNTGIRVQIPRCTVTMNLKGLIYEGHGIMPDHKINTDAASLFNEKDPVMDYTLKLIEQNNTGRE